MVIRECWWLSKSGEVGHLQWVGQNILTVFGQQAFSHWSFLWGQAAWIPSGMRRGGSTKNKVR